MFLMDSAIHSEKDLSDAFGDIAILGVIPNIPSKDSQVYSHASTKNKKSRS